MKFLIVTVKACGTFQDYEADFFNDNTIYIFDLNFGSHNTTWVILLEYKLVFINKFTFKITRKLNEIQIIIPVYNIP